MSEHTEFAEVGQSRIICKPACFVARDGTETNVLALMPVSKQGKPEKGETCFVDPNGGELTLPRGSTVSWCDWGSSGGATGEVPSPSTLVPVADNEVDTAIRTGQVGASLDYARADHNHPIRRQAVIEVTPTAFGNGFTIVQNLTLDRWSDEESFTLRKRVRIRHTAGNGWGGLLIPSLAGFQQPIMTPTGSYRYPSTAIQIDENTGNGGNGASPRGPLMMAEFAEWSSTNRFYSAYYRRDAQIDAYWSFNLTYVRS